MSVIQHCDVCGAVLGKDIEGLGLKFGYKNFGFDACMSCMNEKIEPFILSLMDEIPDVTSTGSRTAYNEAIKARDKRENEEITEEA